MRIFFLTFVFLLCLSVWAFAQHQPVHIPPVPQGAQVQGLDPSVPIARYTHHVWKTEQGLPQNSVWSFCQTHDGYVWMGTEEGLVRFDGVRFTVFNKSNTPALKNNWVNELLEIPIAGDHTSVLWFGTNGGLHLLQNGVFTSYTTKDGLSGNLIVSLLQDRRDGSLWIATRGSGLNHFHNGKFTTYTTKDGLTSNFVHGLAQDRTGALWIGTEGDGGLNCFRNGKFTNYSTSNGLSNNNIWALYLDSSNSGQGDVLWIGTNGGGVSRFQNGTFTNYTTKNGLSNDIITSFWQDNGGSLWIGTWGGGINRLLRDDRGNATITSFTTKQGLSHDVVYSVMGDREGALWVGTQGGGVNRFQNGTFTTYTTKDGLPSDFAVTFAQTPTSGAMWFGTYGGLSRFQNGAFTNYTTNNGLTSNSVHALWQDSNRDGRESPLWIGTWGGGVNCLKNNQFTTYTTKNGLLNNIVTSVVPDRRADGSLWIGTWGGLNRLRHDDHGNGKFTGYTTKDGLSRNFVYALLPDRRDNSLWIGTWGGGLNRLNFDAAGNAKFTSYTTKDGLSNDFTRALMQDREGVLWIGTIGGGLNRFQDGKFTSFTTKDGLYDDHVWCILEDDFGWLWMSCNRGIFRARKADLNAFAEGKLSRITCQAFGTADGMKSAECNGGTPAGWKGQDGRFYFPTMFGVAAVHPDKIFVNPLPPPVIIEEVIADTTMLDLSDAATLPTGVEKLEFRYTATSLHTPERVKFKYLLEGYDKAWTEAGTRRVAYYTNLPRGRQYRFRVIACNNDGIWNETGATVMFYVTPFYWESWWFYGASAVVIVSLGFGMYRVRVGQIQRRAEALERIVVERTTEVSEANAEILRQLEIQAEQAREIEIANSELSEKNIELDTALYDLKQTQAQLVHSEKMAAAGQLTAGVMHEINNPNAAINAALYDLTLTHAQIEAFFLSLLDEQSKQSQRAKQFTDMLHDANNTTRIALTGSERIKGIVAGLQNFTKHQRMGATDGVVAQEIKGTVEMFRYQFKDTSVTLDVPDDLTLRAYWGEINQVLLNILVNASQAEATEIIIVARADVQNVAIRVSDNGCGMSEEVRQRMFEPFFTTKPVGKGTGLGMAIAYSIIEKHGGTIIVESEEGKGTTFIMKLPLVMVL